tara:strand:- start:174 stop:809 length:636 start_codon:yes stop_codon:yes gene_type:complete
MPVVLVDWSDVREKIRHLTLRASVSVQGRLVTLYERVFSFAEYNSPVSHNPFLRELASILPSDCCPLMMTDAGYRNPWFREVEKHGWFWLGRCAAMWILSLMDKPCGEVISRFIPANSQAKYLGCGELGRKNPRHAHLHLYKAKPKHRKDKRSSKAGRNHIAFGIYPCKILLVANALLSGKLWLAIMREPTVIFPFEQLVSCFVNCKTLQA